MRKTFVDTIATIVFFTTLASLTELFIAGMDPAAVLRTRLIMIPMMIITGRPYGLWRDWVFEQISPEKHWSKAIVDGGAFLSFQLPVYAIVLFIAGATVSEVLVLLASTAGLMLIISRPFGLFLDMVRRLGGVQMS